MKNGQNNNYFIIAHKEMLSANAMRISLSFVHPIVVAFVNSRKQFDIKGITFKKNDNNLIIKSVKGKIVGEIQGLSGISPRKTVVIRSQDTELLDKVASEFFWALGELTHVIKHFRHGPGLQPENVYTPIIIGYGVQDNSTQNFIAQLNGVNLNSSTLVKPIKYSIM